MVRVNFNNKRYNLCFEKRINNRLSLYLVDSYGETIAISSDEDVGINEAAVINYGNLQGIEEALIAAGVIGKKPKRKISYGFIGLNVYTLTSYALREASSQEKLSIHKEKNIIAI